jgi:hypothetical protein
MKHNQLFTAIFAMALTQGAFAAEANLFECTGKTAKGERIQLGYTSSSFAGNPTMSLKIGRKQILPVGQDEISALESAQSNVGNLVSSSVNRRHIADAPDLTYSVLLPDVMVDKMGETVEFKTILMSGYSGGFRRLPLAVQVLSQVDQLKCKASFVNF